MLRSIAAVVIGYLVIALFTVVSVAALALIFPEYAQAGESKTMPPPLPVALNLGLGALGAVAGGFACARIAAHNRIRHAAVLAALVFVFGVAFAIHSYGGPHPTWYLVLLPVCGAVGVFIGGKIGHQSAA